MMGVVTTTMMVLGPWPACRFRVTNVAAMRLSLSRIGGRLPVRDCCLENKNTSFQKDTAIGLSPHLSKKISILN